MVEFLETQIFPNYKDHLIILDNAKSHNNDMVKEAILKSGNKYLFFIIFAFPNCDYIITLFSLYDYDDETN
jgi:hypothetical protein